MTDSKVARILRLSQDLTYQFYDIHCDISKAWHTLESIRGNLSSLNLLYEEWLAEQKPFERERNQLKEQK
ncbi:MAG: hypothetical protein ACD_37C00591G0001 [uncultured bacterium]|nr:MAG: hypothetical protein ACD_37C00591G0001 [uncultured bacterium]OFW91264.1 MAG: hypothetical protein A2W46_02570 [Alphaproteobacteria bacterium RIFCSPHIGHO2_12_42_13]